MVRSATGVDVRVLSYNVRALRDDRAALLRVMRACHPDLVCVQEAPRLLRWRTRCAALAHDAGLVVLHGGADASGNLLLGSLRVEVERAGTVGLSHRSGHYRRAVARAVLRVGGQRLVVGGTHLSLDAAQRRDHVREAYDAVSGYGPGPTVLAGDMNCSPGEAPWDWLAGRLRDAWLAAPSGGEYTSGSRDPYQRIDGVFVSDDVEVVRAGVPLDLVRETDLGLASDHRPVLADLRLPPAR